MQFWVKIFKSDLFFGSCLLRKKSGTSNLGCSYYGKMFNKKCGLSRDGVRFIKKSYPAKNYWQICGKVLVTCLNIDPIWFYIIRPDYIEITQFDINYLTWYKVFKFTGMINQNCLLHVILLFDQHALTRSPTPSEFFIAKFLHVCFDHEKLCLGILIWTTIYFYNIG